MEVTVLRATQAQLSAAVDEASGKLNDYCQGKRNELGLVSEDAKTPEYKQLKSAYNNAFQALRTFNAKYAKTIHRGQA